MGEVIWPATIQRRMFGGARLDGLESACVNPAAPAGGSSMLKFYHENSSPPWVEALGQVSGECRADGSGANIFVVTVEPGIFADADTTLLVNSEVAPGWGLHTRVHRARSRQYSGRS